MTKTLLRTAGQRNYSPGWTLVLDGLVGKSEGERGCTGSHIMIFTCKLIFMLHMDV
jgi:hypothetical protein